MDLESALEIAVAAHRGQSDKGGGPYILHPIRVVLRKAWNALTRS